MTEKRVNFQPPKGWYKIAVDSKTERYWKGNGWTKQVRLADATNSELATPEMLEKLDSTRNINNALKDKKIVFTAISVVAVISSVLLTLHFLTPLKPDTQLVSPSSTESVNSQPNFVTTESSNSAEICKLADQRTVKIEERNVGFPLSSDFLPTNGEINLIVMAVDFPDAIASEKPGNYIQSQIEKMNSWAQFSTNGKLVFNIQTNNQWIRSSRPSASYAIEKGSPNKQNTTQDLQNQMTQDLINAAADTFDFSNTQGIIFLFPPNIQGLENDLSAKGVVFSTPQGEKPLFIRGGGMAQYRITGGNLSPKFWQLWVHEILHAMGFPLHAPGNGFNTGIAQNTFGTSATLDAWESFLAGWLANELVYCEDYETLSESQVILTPLEFDKTGNKAAIIRLSSNEAIVVESRRPSGFSSEWPASDSGLLIYRIDTSADNDRTGECCGDNGNDPTWSKWAFYLPADQRKESISGNGQNPGPNSYLIKEGESVSYSGVTVELVYSGDTDFVRITKK